MGIFDYVRAPEVSCPNCGHEVTEWQTKDTPWPALETVDFTAVNNFYHSCTTCGAWIEFTRKPATSLSDFDMRCDPQEKDEEIAVERQFPK